MNPNQDLLIWQKWPHLASMVNDVALRLGLPPYSGGELTLDSDHGIIAQRIAMVVQHCLSRGWWFNTVKEYELTPDAWDDQERYYTVPQFVMSFTIHAQQQDGSPNSLRVVHDIDPSGSTGATKLVVDDPDWEARHPFKVDLTVAPVDDRLPFEFSDYIAARVTNMLSAVFNVASEVNAAYETRAWFDLQRADAVAEKPYNIIDDNPINRHTTRRRW